MTVTATAPPPSSPPSSPPALPPLPVAARTRKGRVAGVEYVVLGDGDPVTVLAHGLAGSTAETRPLAARLPGTRVLLSFRGHGASAPLVDGWSYDGLAADLLAVAGATGATRAVGLSLGAGALLRVLSRQPDRFSRVAFVLPAALDRGRGDAATERLHQLAAAMVAGDTACVERLLLAEVPVALRDSAGVRTLLTRRARTLAGSPPPYPRTQQETPVGSADELAGIMVPALVVAQAEDDLHPLGVARALARALPAAQLLVLPAGGVFWTARHEAATALAEHLA